MHSYLTAGAMEILGIKSMEEWPASIPEDIWLLDKDERQEKMVSILSRITERYIDLQYNKASSIFDGDDGVLKYVQQLLSIGSLYLEFADAIKTGDAWGKSDSLLAIFSYYFP